MHNKRNLTNNVKDSNYFKKQYDETDKLEEEERREQCNMRGIYCDICSGCD